jgi:stage II sporulation protein GA (sporulation sigma-E factor processing peptidase)
MEVTVWGDLLFFVNFCIDFQCLFITAKLLHRKFFPWRSVLFASFGALYAVAALFFATSGAVAFLLDLLVCFLMCVGSFFQAGEAKGRIFLPFLFYFGVSFLVGGAMSGMAALLSHLSLPFGGASGGEVSGGAFFLLALLGGAITLLWGGAARRRTHAAEVKVRVRIEECSAVMVGMVDTANLLVDPMGGRPVIILSARVANRLFCTPYAHIFANSDVESLSSLPPELARRTRLLPSASVAGERLLIGVLPDAVFLDTGRGEMAVDTIIACAPLSLASVACEALVPSSLVN